MRVTSSSSSSISSVATTSTPTRESKGPSTVTLRSEPLSPASSLADRKRALFVKVLREEFLRELMYLWEVANGRAQPRDTLTQKVLAPVQKLGSQSFVPIVGTVLALTSQVASFAASQRRDRQIAVVASLQHSLDLPRLRVLLDVVAREALRRYESFIVDRLSDDLEAGVVPFAQVGARRMIERLFREAKRTQSGDVEMQLNESILLAGLIEGRSGSWVEGFTNHALPLKTHKKNLLKRTRPDTVDAEDVYARAGLRHIEIRDDQRIDTLYVREKPKHSEFADWKEGASNLFAGRIRPLGGFGYVRFRSDKERAQDPVAGFVTLPLAVIRDRYDFKPQELGKLSLNLQTELKVATCSVITVDKTTVAKYLAWRKTTAEQEKSLVDYVRDIVQDPRIAQVVCAENLTGLTLAGADFSHCDFSGAILSGDLTGVNFSHGYLVGAQFQGVTSARNVNLNHAHAEYCQAEGVDFEGSDLTQANFSYAQLSRCQFTGCKIMGTVWREAVLTGIGSDTEARREQKKQTEALAGEVKSQQVQLQTLTDRFQKLQEAQQTQQKLIERLQTDTEQRWQTLLQRMETALATPAKTLGSASKLAWSKIQSQWAAYVKDAQTQGIEALMPIKGFLKSQLQAATTGDLQKALQALSRTWEESLTAFTQSEQTLETVSAQVQQLLYHQESRLLIEADCQRELRDLHQRLDQATDAQIIQALQGELATVQAELSRLRTGTDWQAAFKTCQAECQTQFSVLEEKQSKELARLEAQLRIDCQSRFDEQSQRLSDLEKDLHDLNVALSERLENLEKRVDVLQGWVLQATEILGAQQSEVKDAKGAVKELRTALEGLQAELHIQREQQSKRDQEILALQQRIAAAPDAETVKILQGEIKALKYTLSEVSAASETPPDLLLTALDGYHSELSRQRDLKQKMISKTPALKSKYQPQVVQLEAQEQQLTALSHQLSEDWAMHVEAQKSALAGLQSQMDQVAENCNQRLLQLEADVAQLKSWAVDTGKRLSAFESEESDTRQQLARLQVGLIDWVKQQEDLQAEVLSLRQALKDSAGKEEKYEQPIVQESGHIFMLNKMLPSEKRKNDVIYLIKENGKFIAYWYENNQMIPHELKENATIKLEAYFQPGKLIKRGEQGFAEITSLCGYTAQRLQQLKSNLAKESEVKQQIAAAKASYQEQRDSIQAVKEEEGDPDGVLAETLVDVDKKMKALEEIEQRFTSLHQAILDKLQGDTQQLQHDLEVLSERVGKLESSVKVIQSDLEKAWERINENDPRHTLGKRLLTLRKIVLEDKEISQELAYYIAPNGKRMRDSSDDSATPLFEWVTTHFLKKDDIRVLLLEAPGGAGKSTFNRYLLRQLWLDPAWEKLKPGGPAPAALVPIFAPLGSEQVDPKHLFDYLRDLPELVADFTDTEIQILKAEYRLLWIADGYDEMPNKPFINLYDKNGLQQYQGRVKLLISRRDEPSLTPDNERLYFKPSGDTPMASAYAYFYVARFSNIQMDSYIQKYLDQQPGNPWKDVATYRRHLAQIQNVEHLINTPFLLRIAVEVLPGIVAAIEKEYAKNPQKSGRPSKLEMTQKRLLDGFIEGWFMRQADKCIKNDKDFLEDPGALLGDEVVDELKKQHAEEWEVHCLKKGYWFFCQQFANHLQEDKLTSAIYPPLPEKRPPRFTDFTGFAHFTQVTRDDGVTTATTEVRSSVASWMKELLSPANPSGFSEEDIYHRNMKRCRNGSPLRTTTHGQGRGPAVSIEYSFIHALLINFFEASIGNREQKQETQTISPIPAVSTPKASLPPVPPPRSAPSPSTGALGLPSRPQPPPSPLSSNLSQTLVGSTSPASGRGKSLPQLRGVASLSFNPLQKK